MGQYRGHTRCPQRGHKEHYSRDLEPLPKMTRTKTAHSQALAVSIGTPTGNGVQPAFLPDHTLGFPTRWLPSQAPRTQEGNSCPWEGKGQYAVGLELGRKGHELLPSSLEWATVTWESKLRSGFSPFFFQDSHLWALEQVGFKVQSVTCASART